MLTIDTFLKFLKPFWGKEPTIPTEVASQVQLIIAELLVDNTTDLQLLKFLSRFLTQQAYDEIVEEKNIEHQCGYPPCNNSPKQHVRRLSTGGDSSKSEVVSSIKYQIYNRKPSMILPNTYLSQYCCKDHYRASLFYRNQLSLESIFARKDIFTADPFPSDHPSYWYENGTKCLEDVLKIHKDLKGQGKSLADVISMMSGLSMEENSITQETKDLIKLIEEFEIVEKEGILENDDYGTEERLEEELKVCNNTSNAIEGYITTDKQFGGYMV